MVGPVALFVGVLHTPAGQTGLQRDHGQTVKGQSPSWSVASSSSLTIFGHLPRRRTAHPSGGRAAVCPGTQSLRGNTDHAAPIDSTSSPTDLGGIVLSKKWERRTYQATVAHDQYVRNADRDRWLVEHPGVPFPPSMLTTAEQRAETHIRRLHDSPWEQVRNQLIGQWVLTAVFAGLFLAASVVGVLISLGIVGVMAVHHHRERTLWHELHKLAPEAPATMLSAEEAARIVADWEPPTERLAIRPPRHAA